MDRNDVVLKQYYNHSSYPSALASPAYDAANDEIPLKLYKRTWIVLTSTEIFAHVASILFLAAVVAISVLNIYFADLDLPNLSTILSAFQFLATLHSAIVTSSLMAIALYYLQHELIFRNLPLGYIVYPFELNSAWTLVSARLWRPLFSRTNPRILLFSLGIFVAITVSALANAASAILLIPQLDWWQVSNPFGSTNGFTYLNQTRAFMWPDYLNASNIDPGCIATDVLIWENCPYRNMGAISKWAGNFLGSTTQPNITVTTAANGVRYIVGSNLNTEGFSASSTPMDNMAGDFQSLWTYAQYRTNSTFTNYSNPRLSLQSLDPANPILRPAVQVQCGAPVDITSTEIENIDMEFPANLLNNVQHGNVTASVSVAQYQERPVVMHFQDISKEAGMPLLGALVSLSFYNSDGIFSNYSINDTTRGLIPCTIASHWIPTNISADPTVETVVTMDRPDSDLLVKSDWFAKNSKPVDIDFTYARAMNIPMNSTMYPEKSVIEYELAQLKTFGAYGGYDGHWGSKWQWVAATILSLQLSDAMSQWNWEAYTHMIFCEGCYQNLEPATSYAQDIGAQNTYLGTTPTNKTADQWRADILGRPDLYYPLQWRVDRYGYGWSLSRLISQLSAALLGFHVILILAHIILATSRRRKFTLCRDIIDMVMLANKSSRLQFAYGTHPVEQELRVQDNSLQVLPSGDKHIHAGGVMINDVMSTSSRSRLVHSHGSYG